MSMPSIVYIVGHSWARKLAETEWDRYVKKNGGFEASKQECRYVTRLPEVLTCTDVVTLDFNPACLVPDNQKSTQVF